MNYIESTLISNSNLYSINQYFSYSGDATKINNKQENIFKLIDEIYSNESVLNSVVESLVSLYKEELLFKFSKIYKHDYIVAIKHENEKFNYINHSIVKKLSEILSIEVDERFFQNVTIKNVDIRDYYTKDNDVKIELNLTYDSNHNYIIFDFITSTGFIFESISNKIKNLNNTLFLSYSTRQDCTIISNSKIYSSEEISSVYKSDLELEYGYIVKIGKLFGENDVTVDLTQNPNIIVGENGLGKSNAMKIALLLIEMYEVSVSKKDNYSRIIEENRKQLSYFNFSTVKLIQKRPLFKYKCNILEYEIMNLDNQKIYKNNKFNSIKKDLGKFIPGAEVKHDTFGNGIVIKNNLNFDSYDVDINFYDQNIIKLINYEFFNLVSNTEKNFNRVYLYIEGNLKEVVIVEDGFPLNNSNIDLSNFKWYHDNEYFDLNNVIISDIVLIGESPEINLSAKQEVFESIRFLKPNIDNDLNLNFELSKEYINYELLPVFDKVNNEELLKFYNSITLPSKLSYQKFLEFVKYYYLISSFKSEAIDELYVNCFNIDYHNLLPNRNLYSSDLLKEINNDDYSNILRMLNIEDYFIYDEIENLISKYTLDETVDNVYYQLLEMHEKIKNTEDLYARNFYLSQSNILFINSTIHRAIKAYVPERMYELLNSSNSSNYSEYFEKEFSISSYIK